MPQIQDVLKSRKSGTPFGYGLSTAAPYVSNFLKYADSDTLKQFAAQDGGDLLKHAEGVLTYCNEDMVCEKASSSHRFKDLLPDGVAVPKNTLMVIKHVLTTTKEDRDSDVLVTGGATLDPKAPLLWQHIHTLPIGKVVSTISHTDEKLVVASALLDLNDLTSDAAKLVEAGVLRFSHGFRALEFQEQKNTESGLPGFRVTKFEIMEASLVSVPSNVDAEVEEVASQKFSSEFFKSYQQDLVGSHKSVTVQGVDLKMEEAEDEDEEESSDDEEVQDDKPEGKADDGKDAEAEQLKSEYAIALATIAELEKSIEIKDARVAELEAELVAKSSSSWAFMEVMKLSTPQLKRVVDSILNEIEHRKHAKTAKALKLFRGGK